jgi:hypothetical protein
MAGVLPDHILVHRATPRSYVEAADAGPWLAGEPGARGPEVVLGAPFPCVLFLPSPGGAQDTTFRPKVVKRPTLLFNPTRLDGSLVLVGSEDELAVSAPELEAWTGAAEARWQVDGDPQPFGPPGLVYGVVATLKIVRD